MKKIISKLNITYLAILSILIPNIAFAMNLNRFDGLVWVAIIMAIGVYTLIALLILPSLFAIRSLAKTRSSGGTKHSLGLYIMSLVTLEWAFLFINWLELLPFLGSFSSLPVSIKHIFVSVITIFVLYLLRLSYIRGSKSFQEKKVIVWTVIQVVSLIFYIGLNFFRV